MEAPPDRELAIALRPSAELDGAALDALFAESALAPPAFDLERSLCWVSAHAGERLVGFVNVAWDGGRHAFLLDSVVHPSCRRRGKTGDYLRTAFRPAVRHFNDPPRSALRHKYFVRLGGSAWTDRHAAGLH